MDDACTCCGRDAGWKSLGRIDGTDTGERFSLERCRACGVGRTVPQPADLAPYYATELARTMSAPSSRLFAALRRRQLALELRRITRHGDPGTVVDVGCGSGDFVAVVRAHGFRAIAVDAAAGPPGALAARTDVPYRRFDFDRYAFDGPGEPAPDTVILRHVLEHVRDPHACLERLRAAGARRLYVVVPNAGSRERRWLGPSWYSWDPPRHLWHFEPAALTTVCARAGWRPLAHGTGTAPTLVPSLYRHLRLRGWAPTIYERFGPTSRLTALTAPLNLLLGGNVLWLVARAAD